IVSRTDPAFTTATFGLARSRLALGDRAGALAAYDRVPEASSSYVETQVARIECLVGSDGAHTPELADLRAAATSLEALDVDVEQRARLESEILERAAVLVVERGAVATDPDDTMLGCPLIERDLRERLEESYRALARLAKSSGERIRLVDLANDVRP